MARVGTTNNLEGTDKYDLMIFDFPEGYPIGKVNMKFGNTPHRISGVQKVSQIFLKTLTTPIGSDILYPDSGTKFGELVGTYNLHDVTGSALNSVVRSAVSAAEKKAKAILNITSASPSSQLESATVVNLTTIEDGISIQVKLLTKAGEAAPIALPFTSLGIKVNE